MPSESEISELPEGLQDLMKDPLASDVLKTIGQTIIEINLILARGAAWEPDRRKMLLEKYVKNIELYKKEKQKLDENSLYSPKDQEWKNEFLSWRDGLKEKNQDWRYILLPNALRQLAQVYLNLHRLIGDPNSALIRGYDVNDELYAKHRALGDFVREEIKKWKTDIHYLPDMNEINKISDPWQAIITHHPEWQDYFQQTKPAHESIYELQNNIQITYEHLLEKDKIDKEKDPALNEKLTTILDINKILNANISPEQKHLDLDKYISENKEKLDQLIDAIRKEAVNPELPEGLQDLMKDSFTPVELKAVEQTILEIHQILNGGISKTSKNNENLSAKNLGDLLTSQRAELTKRYITAIKLYNTEWQNLRNKRPAYEIIYEIRKIMQPYQRHFEKDEQPTKETVISEINDNINKILNGNARPEEKCLDLNKYISENNEKFDHLERRDIDDPFWIVFDAIREAISPKLPEGLQDLITNPVVPEEMKALAQTILEINQILNCGATKTPKKNENLSTDKLKELLTIQRVELIIRYRNAIQLYYEVNDEYNKDPLFLSNACRETFKSWRDEVEKNLEFQQILLPEALKQVNQVRKELNRLYTGRESPAYFAKKLRDEQEKIDTFAQTEFQKWKKNIHYQSNDYPINIKKICNSWQKKVKAHSEWKEYLRAKKPGYEIIYEIRNIIQSYQKHFEKDNTSTKKIGTDDKLAAFLEINKNINIILNAAEHPEQKYEALNNYISENKDKFDQLEKRRGNNPFWIAIDKIKEVFGFPPSTTGVTGAKVVKNIHGLFNKSSKTTKDAAQQSDSSDNKKSPS